ncbi:hypothetical protein U1Q18_003123 [Sarracenia purpurea var. burkii]
MTKIGNLRNIRAGNCVETENIDSKLVCVKSYVVDESDEDVEDIEEEHRPQDSADEDEESEIIESDVELEGEIMEPDNESVYIKLKKPNAAIRDANAALEMVEVEKESIP